MKATLRPPQDDSEWATYHDIRRHVLFELRGRGLSYDASHPDEHRAGHHPLVLWAGDAAVGVLRVDITGTVAVFRRVAVRPEVQRRGYGQQLLRLAEQFAKTHGCTRIESHVDPDAVAFYERCGFAHLTDPHGPGTIPLMGKAIL
jgi:GNAT superfamily N-acetyltransferase